MASKNEKLNKTVTILLYVLSGVLLVGAIITCIFYVWSPKPEVDESWRNDTSVSLDNDELPINPMNFENIKAKYPEVCGWIKFDCLDIDYAIVRPAEPKDTNYYLRRDLDGNYSTGGAIYIQQINRADFSDNCTIIYGHNMTNLSMFGTLKYFRDKDFFDQNKYFEIYTPNHILRYAIKSAFVYNDSLLPEAFSFNSKNDFMRFAEEASNPKSLVRNVRDDVEINWGDRLAVLSTCTNYDNERYLVVAVLEEDIETQ